MPVRPDAGVLSHGKAEGRKKGKSLPLSPHDPEAPYQSVLQLEGLYTQAMSGCNINIKTVIILNVISDTLMNQADY